MTLENNIGRFQKYRELLTVCFPSRDDTQNNRIDKMEGELEPITITATHDEAVSSDGDSDCDGDSDGDFEELRPLQPARMRVPTASGPLGRVLNEWTPYRLVSSAEVFFAPPHAHAP
jgi:hypothetical protein